MAPLTRRVLEAVAAAMGWDAGSENIFLGFEKGELRRWSRRDENNSPLELALGDENLRYELDRLLDAA